MAWGKKVKKKPTIRQFKAGKTVPAEVAEAAARAARQRAALRAARAERRKADQAAGRAPKQGGKK